MKKHILASIGIFIGTSGLGAADDTSWRALVDLDRADVSTFSMKMLNSGNEVGSMTYGWERSGDTYVIRDRTEMQPNILETAKGVIDAETLMPISNFIDFATGASKNVFDLKWKNGAMTGGVKVSQEGKEPRNVDLSNADHPDSIIRLSIFGVIAGLPWEDGFSVDLPWYNTLSNSIENITLAHVGSETVETPAGSLRPTKFISRMARPRI